MRRAVRRRRGRRGTRSPLGAVALLLGLLLVLTAAGLSWLRPRLAEHAQNAVEYQATFAIEQAISEAMQQEGQRLSALNTLEDGRAAALVTDSAAAEQVRTQAVQNAYNAINALEQMPMSVAIGTLVDPQYLAGVGPKLPFSVVGLGRISSNMYTEFTDSGINQTRYCLLLHMKAEVQLHALWCSRTVIVEMDYPLSEAIIVGEVPQVNVQ
ncbi:MAG: sporulation protein YunB [Butyricicoccus sp.]